MQLEYINADISKNISKLTLIKTVLINNEQANKTKIEKEILNITNSPFQLINNDTIDLSDNQQINHVTYLTYSLNLLLLLIP